MLCYAVLYNKGLYGFRSRYTLVEIGGDLRVHLAYLAVDRHKFFLKYGEKHRDERNDCKYHQRKFCVYDKHYRHGTHKVCHLPCSLHERP